MNNIFLFFKNQFLFFAVNPFWKKWPILVIIAVSIAINIFIWYEYLKHYREIVNLTPMGYASAVLLLDIILADISYPRKDIAAYFLVGTGLLIQLFFLYYLKIASLQGAY